MAMRSVEDYLRDQYSDLLPTLRLAREELESIIRSHLVKTSRNLQKYEFIRTTSRIKDCASAIQKLRSSCEGGFFDKSLPPGTYDLKKLEDLVGVRVLAFPRQPLEAVHGTLHKAFPRWVPDHLTVPGYNVNPAVYKYKGCLPEVREITVEYQIAPMLLGLFWEVEHDTLYKPALQLKGIKQEPALRESAEEVMRALRHFETKFEETIAASLKGMGGS
jgi:hypothetical protein